MDERGYLELLGRVLERGERREGRNGWTRSLFGERLEFDVARAFPLLTTKRVFWRGVVEELLFFLRGATDTTQLEERGVGIWRGNTSAEFIQEAKLELRPGEMGPMYGFQWRNFNGQGVDQLAKVVEGLRRDPHSRRLLMTSFNPAQAEQGVLYPCHGVAIQFYVRDGRFLDLHMYQRSADMFLGVPFNIASYALLMHIVGALTLRSPGRLIISFGDVHLYEAHLDAAREQLGRLPRAPPQLVIDRDLTLEALTAGTVPAAAFQLADYSPHPPIRAEMIA